jgi:hypothetical protein
MAQRRADVRLSRDGFHHRRDLDHAC